MNTMKRALGFALVVAGLSACGAATGPLREAPGVSQARMQCRAGGDICRWDDQCCSGRCYVDLGCSG